MLDNEWEGVDEGKSKPNMGTNKQDLKSTAMTADEKRKTIQR